MAVNYSILVDVDFETQQIQKKLNQATKGAKVDVDTKGIKNLDGTMQDTSLTFAAANEIFHKSIDVIGSMTKQVFTMDKSMTEFKKVSDLSGEALDNYIVRLTEAGSTVARTGKPKCQTPNVEMINQHLYPL